MRNDLEELLSGGPRVAGSATERVAGRYLSSVLADLAPAGVRVERVPLPDGNESRNVATSLGSGDVELLLGAHYDSITGSPGADDNASGAVLLLELARRLSDRPAEGITVQLVFFGAEEVLPGRSRDDHHYGSRQMADHLQEGSALPHLMVSVDMVGFGTRLLAVTYRNTDPTAAEMLIEAGALQGVEVTLAERGDISDHEAFARRDVPSVFMWRPDNPAYHTARDDSVRFDLLLENLAVLEEFIELAGKTDA